MTKESSKKWMDWYRHRGGREKVLAKRKETCWMSKKEYERLTAQ